MYISCFLEDKVVEADKEHSMLVFGCFASHQSIHEKHYDSIENSIFKFCFLVAPLHLLLLISTIYCQDVKEQGLEWEIQDREWRV